MSMAQRCASCPMTMSRTKARSLVRRGRGGVDRASRSARSLELDRVPAQTSKATRTLPAQWPDLLPGIALSAAVAAVGYIAAPYVAKVAPIPNIVIALVDRHRAQSDRGAAGGAARHGLLRAHACCAGRWRCSAYASRVGEIAALGLATAVLIVRRHGRDDRRPASCSRRWSGRNAGFGALVGVGTAVCGASATLA